MLFKLETLGCKVNQYETQYVRTTLLANGFIESQEEEDEAVQLVVVNTCSITAESDAKSRKAISRLSRKCPQAKIVVMGCYAASHPAKIVALPLVQTVLTDKRQLDELLLHLGCSVLPGKIDSFQGHHRAFVKIQDGCLVGCAYCIIPKVRPYLSSRPPNEILDEIHLLCQHGYRELVLTGIHLGHYGLNSAKNDRTERFATLAGLLEMIVAKNFPARFRLGSLEAVEVTDPLLEVVASFPKLFTPHFHLSMQSGDDNVLERMARRWKSTPFIEKCQQIRERIPDVALTTDLIVGFPGETDDQFLRTCQVVEQLRFSKVHLFRFSPRPGTKAATMTDPVPESVKKERIAHLEKIAASLQTEYASHFIDKQVTILLEEQTCTADGKLLFSGTSEHYLTTEIVVPTDYARTFRCGSLCDVIVQSILPNGELVAKFSIKL